jgi:tripartite-type tricarboxylate transporter receptor subunit TctC
MTRRVTGFLVVVLAALLPTVAWTQTYPLRAVKVIVATAPGGLPDVIARLVAEKLREAWASPVIVENRPGASGNIATEMVVRSAPDGYTLLSYDSPIWAINPHLFAKLPYDPLKDLAPVAQIVQAPLFLVVPSSGPITNVAQLIAYAKKNPGKVTYASAGTGSSHHLTAELFKSMAGIEIVHVAYKGGAPAAVALNAGEVQMGFISFPLAQAGVSGGKLRMLGIGTAERSPDLPDIPTVAEGGLPGFELYTTTGWLAPAGTPREVIAKIHAGIAAAAAAPDVRKRLASFGVTVATLASPEQFGAVMRSEYEKFGRLVKLSGARME